MNSSLAALVIDETRSAAFLRQDSLVEIRPYLLILKSGLLTCMFDIYSHFGPTSTIGDVLTLAQGIDVPLRNDSM